MNTTPGDKPDVEMLRTAVSGLLAKETSLTPDRIRQLIHKFRGIPGFDVDDIAAEQLAREFEAQHNVTMSVGSVLIETGYEPWLEGTRAQIDPYYWNRYRSLLVEQGYSAQVLATLDQVTDRILGLLENPEKPGPWDRRGMVVGHVQSGKTANYIGLMNKAADAGYRLVVVIAGIHNNLRNQTQRRIDEGFVGRDSARLLTGTPGKVVGVGRFNQSRRPIYFTTSKRDFSKASATSVGIPLQNLAEPALFVIKKNSSTLKNLIEWLREHSAGNDGTSVDAPMLLIDDEADNASINIRHGRGEVSRINGQIRELLKMFKRSCYVGYTATPFANIFIDPETDDEMRGEDLFPRHFIVSLDPPSNYFGASRVFADDNSTVVRSIHDHDHALPLDHKIDHRVHSLPPSLDDAVRTFVLARAIRIERGQGTQHSSMMVNASRFTNVQAQLRNEIHNRLLHIQASARLWGQVDPSRALQDGEIAALQSVWAREYQNTGFDWVTIQRRLHEAAAPIRVEEVNTRSSASLNYADHEKAGLHVIAVGGYSLSRGLTLEGLVVSYFLRRSIMYDTLMQMGRWFGYRAGYEDLCRIWMLDEAAGWYAHIAASIEELREELRTMEAANATPEEFGLKVRAHPDTLIVTARNKIGSGQTITASIGLANRFVETTTLWLDPQNRGLNRLAAAQLAKRLSEAGFQLSDAERYENGSSLFLRGVPAEPILRFLGEFRNHPDSMLSATEPIRQYIENRIESELRVWDLLIPSLGEGSSDSLTDDLLGVPIRCQRRSRGSPPNPKDGVRVGNRQRVSSRGVERAGLSKPQIEAAQKEYFSRRTDTEGSGALNESPNFPDRIYRHQRTRPLLVLHLLSIVDEQGRPIVEEPCVAWSISFPGSAIAEDRVEYVVSTAWIRENSTEDLAEEELGGDND